jgi:hypothetical protein
MKLIGKGLPANLTGRIEARLRERGIDEPPRPIEVEGPAPRVDPRAFFLSGLDENADPTAPLQLHTHRAGLGRAVVGAKWLFRKVARVAVVDTLSRQRVFNGYVRDAFLQVFSELTSLERRLAALENERPGEARAGPPKRRR